MIHTRTVDRYEGFRALSTCGPPCSITLQGSPQGVITGGGNPVSCMCVQYHDTGTLVGCARARYRTCIHRTARACVPINGKWQCGFFARVFLFDHAHGFFASPFCVGNKVAIRAKLNNKLAVLAFTDHTRGDEITLYTRTVTRGAYRFASLIGVFRRLSCTNNCVV